jgi:ADP-ribose pyrophosphatase YjhB (NUDIX family)
MNPPNRFCHFCGTAFADVTKYPRSCAICGAMIWANPIPVAVALVPTDDGLLVVRRGIPPGVGKLALVGGFIEDHESWQVGCAREVREETNIVVDPESCQLHWISSSEPTPNRLLIFAVTPAVASPLPAFVPNHETQERGVIFGPGGLEAAFIFSTHIEAVRRYFAARGITKHHAFAPR